MKVTATGHRYGVGDHGAIDIAAAASSIHGDVGIGSVDNGTQLAIATDGNTLGPGSSGWPRAPELKCCRVVRVSNATTGD